MTRLDLQPDNNIPAALKTALSDIEQIKQQQTIGSDSLRPHILSSTKVYDFTSEFDSFNPVPPLYYVDVNIAFTADHQLNPYVRAFADLFDLSGNPFPWTSVDDLSAGENTKNILTFYVDDYTFKQYFSIRSATQFRLKLYLQASDSGSYALTVTFGIPAP